jgi:4-hydroxymandelate oxidase
MSQWMDELEERARSVLPDPVERYYRQGSGRGRTAAEAAEAWATLRYRPHVLCDVTSVDPSTTVLDTLVAAPVLVAPTTLQLLAHAEGDRAMAAGARDAGSLLCVSSNTGVRFEEIGATGVNWWLQAYVVADRDATSALVGRAVTAGARAVAVTVDTPVVATKPENEPMVWDLVRDDQIHANLDLDRGQRGIEKARDLTGETIAWLTAETGLPVVVKGVLRADDATIAAEAGAAAIIVSNHGGRQLDQSVSTVEALPEVVAAVGGRVEVYVDGGVRSGLDVLGAVALGARAAFVGRPALWALAVDGETGVARLLTELRQELVEAMTLAGCANVDQVTADLVAGPTTQPFARR